MRVVARLALMLPLLAVAGAPLAAQQPAPPTVALPLIGTWEGTFQSDHVLPGPMRLVVARDSAWRVTMQVRANDQEFTSVASEVALEGNVLSWQHETMGQSCRGHVMLDGALLRGETSCGAGGLSFALTRVTPATGGPRD